MKGLKPGFHYPSWRPELTDDRFPLPVNTGRVDGRAVFTSRVDGPSTRVVETGLKGHRPYTPKKDWTEREATLSWHPPVSLGVTAVNWTEINGRNAVNYIDSLRPEELTYDDLRQNSALITGDVLTPSSLSFLLNFHRIKKIEANYIVTLFYRVMLSFCFTTRSAVTLSTHGPTITYRSM